MSSGVELVFILGVFHAQQRQEDAEDEHQFDAGAHCAAPARKTLTFVRIVRTRARHNKAMPIPIEVCGIQSGVASGVGATSSERYEFIARRTSCQVTSAVAAND